MIRHGDGTRVVRVERSAGARRLRQKALPALGRTPALGISFRELKGANFSLLRVVDRTDAGRTLSEQFWAEEILERLPREALLSANGDFRNRLRVALMQGARN